MKPCTYCGQPTDNIWYDGIRATCEECDDILNEIGDIECTLDELQDEYKEIMPRVTFLEERMKIEKHKKFVLEIDLQNRKESAKYTIGI